MSWIYGIGSLLVFLLMWSNDEWMYDKRSAFVWIKVFFFLLVPPAFGMFAGGVLFQHDGISVDTYNDVNLWVSILTYVGLIVYFWKQRTR